MLNKNVEITLLSKEEVGKSKVLQTVGAGCGVVYWTRTLSGFNIWSYTYEFDVYSSGALSGWDVYNVGGVRPVLKSDNLKELIKDCKSDVVNGIRIIEYGNFPHMLESVKIYDLSLLQSSNNEYILPSQKDFKMTLERFAEYDYNGQKVISDGEVYHPVKPIKWYLDEGNNMLIAKDVLFKAPINVDNENYNGAFDTSELYSYLNHGFLVQLTITPNDRAELESRIERLLRRKQELLNQSESLDNELRNGQKVKLL